MKISVRDQLKARKRQIDSRLDKTKPCDFTTPMFTAGDFCRRFNGFQVDLLQDIYDEARVGVWKLQPAAKTRVRLSKICYSYAYVGTKHLGVGYPTISCEGILNGNREKGINENERILICSAGRVHGELGRPLRDRRDRFEGRAIRDRVAARPVHRPGGRQRNPAARLQDEG